MDNQITTVIVLRNDTKEAWETSNSYILTAGEVGVGYMTVTVDAEAGTTKKVPIVKIGDGATAWKDLPQAEGVFENDVILTSAFGKYSIPAAGYVNAGGAGMTTSEWLLDALSEVKEPSISEPSITTTASIVGGGELGSKITGVKWTGTYTDGSYQYGSVSHPSSTATGLSASNVTWAISNDNDTQTAATEDGTFTFASADHLTVDSESSKTYVTISAKYSLDATNARTPLNNVGAATDGKIESRTDVINSAEAKATGYRKPFWGALTSTLDVDALTSAQVRELPNSGSKTKGFPSTLAVAAGCTQVIFCAKAGTYSSLSAKDSLAMNAGVTFTKVANAVNVEGANGYTETAYDLWYVQWADPIASAKSLTLTWS